MNDRTDPMQSPDTGHVWDDTLRELKNPPPRWWTLTFYASFIFWIGYGILYPMWPTLDSNTKGVLGWSQIKEYQQGMAEVEAVRAQYEDKMKDKSAAEIAADPELSNYAIASAKVLFGDYCAACHGAGGQGNPGFPVLADDDWLYGGSIDKIQETVTGGRNGMMIAHGKSLSSAEIDTLANYVAGLSQGQDDPAGKAAFTQKGCIACHGPDGKGVQAMGAANLTDAIWRFAPGGAESARYTITHGVNDPSDPATRSAVMPAFKDRLNDTAIKKLAVYVHNLGGGQ